MVYLGGAIKDKKYGVGNRPHSLDHRGYLYSGSGKTITGPVVVLGIYT